ncbi:hypothetical protein [Bacillus velezensis]|uniref:hypothetical protein n=1 Tax=Bacillus velezensis TaxID=492670 RepID=UPI00100A1771|nr:hypothetical protein [Bacillus velezensis]MEC0403099.1 hypothetical protein [Bacillus velezensis]QAW23942.1 hypothetical protein ETA12_04680 [Bacillus velezensis]WJN56599.1 hypothetical protein QTN52_09930 [Bacillus velezensis]
MAETKKYVRIKKASIEGAWYADKLGQIFEVYYENSVALGAVCYGYYSVLREDGELIITEKRPAKVGERVLITGAYAYTGCPYKNGDINNVKTADEYGHILVEEHSVSLLRREYEVIVNNEIKNEEADEMKIDLNAMGYDELLAHGDAVMEAIKKRTFQEGFQAAKQVQRKLAKMKTSINTQARRDEIVEQAKADVKGLFKRDLGYRHDFIVNSEKRTVVALRKSFVEGYVRDRGIAKATPDDCFNIHIGKAIALRRALGLAVPDEYLNAPQPTEVRVGDFVSDDSGVNKALVIEDDSWPPFSGGAVIYLKDARKYCYRIIDDSREEVGE